MQLTSLYVQNSDPGRVCMMAVLEHVRIVREGDSAPESKSSPAQVGQLSSSQGLLPDPPRQLPAGANVVSLGALSVCHKHGTISIRHKKRRKAMYSHLSKSLKRPCIDSSLRIHAIFLHSVHSDFRREYKQTDDATKH